MALSGTFSNAYRGYTYQISWSAEQKIAGNYSTITCTHKLICASTYSLYINGRTNTCVINGTSKNFTSDAISTSGGGTIILGTTTHTVNHNSNGTGSFSITGTFNMQATISGTYVGSIVTSGSATLNTIPRSSTITSAAAVTLGNKCSVKWTPAASTYKYKIKFTLGDWSYTTGFISPGITSAYTYTGYTIPNTRTLLEKIPNNPSGTMTATLYTYNSNGTKIGSTDSKSFKVTIPDSVKPTVGDIVLNPENITISGTSYNYLIKGKNKLSVKAGPYDTLTQDSKEWTAGTGSTIKSYKFSGPSLSTTKTTTANNAAASISSVTTTGFTNETKTLTYRVTVTDTRGRSNYAEKTITCYDYYSPSFTTFKPVRNGKTLTCTYKVSYASINSTNSATVEIYVGGTLKKTINAVKRGTSYTETITLSSADASYSVYAKVTDGLGTSVSSATSTAYGASKIININSKGNGVAFGKMAEEENCVDVPKLWSRGNIVAKTNNTGFYVTNKSGNTEPAIFKHTNSLWIGSNAGTHITGSTYISAGDDTTGIYVSKLVNNTRTSCLLLDENNSPGVRPTELYSIQDGNAGTVPLNQSAAKFTYLEIFYADNNGNQSQSVKVYNPNDKLVTLSCIEPRDSGTALKMYLRSMEWYIVDNKIIPGTYNANGKALYCSLENSKDTAVTIYRAGDTYTDGSGNIKTRSNYIKIFKVVGYA